jgi:hypothetical protein
MENNLKAILALVASTFFMSCSPKTDDRQKITKMDTSEVSGKIVYKLDSNLIKFIEDSVMDKDLNTEIISCKFHIDGSFTKVFFRYKDDDTALMSDYLAFNTNRFLGTKYKLIPIDFEEDIYADMSFIDESKVRVKTTNWMNYAELKFNTRNEIVSYENHYRKLLKAEGKIR